MNEHVNRGCTNHGCVYHYVYPELAKGMHTNGPCHCKARPVADYLYRQNAQLKAELVKAVDERDELQKLYDAGKATWDPVYKIVLDERDQLKERLAYQDRWLSGGVYYTNDEATALYKKHNDEVEKLKAELAQATQREQDLERRLKVMLRRKKMWELAWRGYSPDDITRLTTEDAALEEAGT